MGACDVCKDAPAEERVVYKYRFGCVTYSIPVCPGCSQSTCAGLRAAGREVLGLVDVDDHLGVSL